MLNRQWPALADALSAWDPNSYVQYEDQILHSKCPQPEHECIKNDMFQKLSKDAKTVIELVLSSPTEFAAGLYHTVIGETSIPKLHEYLYERYYWSKAKRQAIFNEIREAVKCL